MKEVGREAASGRRLFALDVAIPDDIPAAFPLPGPYFICLLAWDARQASAAEIGEVAGRLLAAGCVYAVCWGPACERVHDAFDEADLAWRPNGPWAMTTWHTDEPLSESIRFALFNARPDDAFAEGCRSVVGVSIGSRAWATEVGKAFASPRDFIARDLGNR